MRVVVLYYLVIRVGGQVRKNSRDMLPGQKEKIQCNFRKGDYLALSSSIEIVRRRNSLGHRMKETRSFAHEN